MKGQVGNNDGLLWPSRSVMVALSTLARSHQTQPDSEEPTIDLLWPANLSYQLPLATYSTNFTWPLAIATFILSIIIAIIIGPVQLVLIATTLDYNWVISTYYPLALHYILLIATVLSIFCVLITIFEWKIPSRHFYQISTLSLSSLIIITFIWLSGNIISWQPHQLTLILLVTIIIAILFLLLISKQHFSSHTQHTVHTVIFGITTLFAATNVILAFSGFITTLRSTNDAQIEQIATAMQSARLDDVPEMLSDITYLLCHNKYKVIYLAENKTNGLFECANNDVYSVTDSEDYSSASIHAAATYLGTTHNSAVSLSFPTARYLYRSLPDALTEDELAIMYPAATETELLDNVTAQLLDYWDNHSDRALFVNIFYNTNLDTVTSTRDFILMAARGTMALTDQLPDGNTRQGPLNRRLVTFIYAPDTDFLALNELGANPKLYPSTTRDSLTTYRHLSLRLQPGESYGYDTLHAKLETSFISPEV